MIELRNVKKSYRNGDEVTEVLKGITFSVKEGEFIAIMGPSGSGKSTLMHIIGALDRPTSGQYLLDERDVSTFPDDELAKVRRDRIGFIFQAFNLLPRATVLRNVMLPLIYAEFPTAMRKEKAEAALRSAGLAENRWDHLSNQLSGGQMQRVAIARALVNDPAILLADEPTGNLDTKTGEIVLHTFQRLNQEEKRTIVLITHERYVAEHADRIITLRDGEIMSDEINKNKRVSDAHEDHADQ
jgi:putative ABC transport system ATP-binding protein